MSDVPPLRNPWLIAVWPGMGHVALNAGYYLLSKLQMNFVAEFAPRELFEVEYVEVHQGVIQLGRLPQSRFFVWRDPDEVRDVVVFIGEAQPVVGKHAFCHKLIDFAKTLGVERVFTFAAMATEMHPKRTPRIFGAATDEEGVAELRRLDLEVLEDGQIGGLNGVLLGVASEQGLRGSCLLGEVPHVFSQWPFPRAALAVLTAFSTISGLKVDFAELEEQSYAVEDKLEEILTQVGAAMEKAREAEGAEEQDAEEDYYPQPEPLGPQLEPEERERIERLFEQAKENRAKAYELKTELDRLEVFKDYEDRFLDLFKRSE